MITIPKEFWFVHSVSENKFPLSYLTHNENNAECRKRKETGTHWAEGYGKYINGKYVTDPIKENTFDNKPIEGFTIEESKSRWSTSNVVWRIIDPRGFTVEIYSGNLENIIRHSTIINGVIKGKCIWGREEGKNILINEGSQEYKEGIEGSVNKASKIINMKNVPVGSTVKLKSKVGEWIYMGVLTGNNIYSRMNEPSGECSYYFNESGHFFFEKNAQNINEPFYRVKSSPVIEIINEPVMTYTEIIELYLKTLFESREYQGHISIPSTVTNKDGILEVVKGFGIVEKEHSTFGYKTLGFTLNKC